MPSLDLLPGGDLPVRDALPGLLDALSRGNAVLVAPPGAGKTTLVPLALLDAPWRGDGRILVLEPRRLAARAAATRMAHLLGEPVGQTVGFRTRLESAVSPATRIEVLTEGLLVRRLVSDSTLDGVAAVLLDEVHERSLDADLAMAFCLDLQRLLRPELRLLAMSATLDGARLSTLLDAPVIESQGRMFPVMVEHAARDVMDPRDLPDATARAIRAALATHEGDVLAFLPGVAEIRRALAALGGRHPEVDVLPLYGDLGLEAQQAAILPGPQGQRRVVLATSIAETSLTIPGVRVVVDSGWTRRQHFDPGTGLSRLTTERVTLDAADQRAGRAGRTAPGTALRLWSERTQAALAAARSPEMLEADLSPLTLELAGWGTPDPAALHWLDAPPTLRVEAARTLLRELDAVDDAGRATPVGLSLLELPTHPRLSHLLRGSVELGLAPLAADLAAVLEERDPLGRDAGTDLTARLDALRRHRGRQGTPGDVAALERAERLSRHWRSALGCGPQTTAPDPFSVGRLVALAYPERVALLREGSRDRYLLAGGQGVRLPEADPLAGEAALAVAHLDGRLTGGEGRVYLAAPLDPAVLAARAETVDAVHWETRTGTLVAQREQRVGALLLGAEPLRQLPPELRAAAMTDAVRQEGLARLHWPDEARQLQARVGSLRAWRGDDWPALSDAALLERLGEWLPPLLGQARTREDLGRVNMLPGLQSLLTWPLPRELGELAPTHLIVPSGSRVRLEYREDGEPPILAVKLQELFGLADTPAVNAGRVPVLLHLLSPARRPVQVTQDLRSFWQKGYFEARKDLKGQYPRHPWPDDPWTAEATRKAKPRGT